MDTDSEEIWFPSVLKMVQLLGKGQWVRERTWYIFRMAGLSWLSLGSGHRCLFLGNSPLVANRNYCSNPRTTVGNLGRGSESQESLLAQVTSRVLPAQQGCCEDSVRYCMGSLSSFTAASRCSLHSVCAV